MTCPTCNRVAFLETLECAQCLTPLGLHRESSSMLAVNMQGAVLDGRTWVVCANRAWGCNWLLPDDEETARCAACRLIRRQPDADDTMAWEKLATAAVDLRRLLVQLHEVGLPVVGWHEREGGLGFDLLSSRTANTPVMIGHANGIITIDLVESLADYRESMRVRLGEPYRTMLGHFRHEVGHYYEWILVESAGDPTLLEHCRRLFGDERASYSDAIDRHDRTGPPVGWKTTYISEYATMHPWEDFAECFAHYLHIQGTLSTAASGGLGAPGRPDTGGPRCRPRAGPGLPGPPGRTDPGRLAGPVPLLQPDQPGDGPRRPLPLRDPGPGGPQLAFVHRLVRGASQT